MSDIKWIKIATDIFDNRKIKMLESMPDGDSMVVIWFKLLSLAGTVNDNGCVYFTKDLPYTPQMLATAFNRPLTTIELALNTFKKFGMIDIANDLIYVSNWQKYQNIDGMDKIREQNRIRQQKFRQQKRLTCNADVTDKSVTNNITVTDSNVTDNVTCNADVTDNVMSNVTVTQSNGTDIDIDIDINNINKPKGLLSDNENLSDTEQPESENENPKQYDDIISEWNTLEDLGITPLRIIGPNSERGRLLRARIKQYGRDSFTEIVSKIRESDFLQGRHDGRFWQVTFDWVIKPNNYPKVLEGNYDNKPLQNSGSRVRNFCNIQQSYSSEDIAEIEAKFLDN